MDSQTYSLQFLQVTRGSASRRSPALVLLGPKHIGSYFHNCRKQNESYGNHDKQHHNYADCFPFKRAA